MGLLAALGLAGGAWAGSYEQAFGPFALGTTNFNDGSELRSSALGTVAAVADATQKELQLVAWGLAETRTAFALPDLDPGLAVRGCSILWNSQVYVATNRGEGFSLTLGRLPAQPESDAYAQESHFATGVTFSVRTGGVVSNAGFRVYANGVEKAFRAYGDWGLRKGYRHAFEATVQPSGAVNLWMDGTQMFANVASGYTPQPGDRLWFAARTSTNAAAEVRLDNIVAVSGGVLGEAGWLRAEASVGGAATETPDRAFDRLVTTKWLMTAATGYLQARTADVRPHRMLAYSIASANDAAARDPHTWRLLGSRDGVLWTNLDTEVYGDWGAHRYCRRAFLIDSPGAFAWYRLQVDSNHGDASTQLAELRLLETPPTAGVTSSVVVTTLRDCDRTGLTQTPFIAKVDGGGYTPAVVAGNALGNVLQLTDGGGSEAASIAFARTGNLTAARYGAMPVVLVDFDFRIQPVTGQADGLSLVLLRTVDHGLTGAGAVITPAEEPNLTSATGPCLGIGFDVHPNADEPNDNHVSVHYGTLLTNAMPAFDFSTDRFHHAQVRVAFRANRGGADVTVRLQENSLGMGAAASGSPVTVVSNLFIAGLTPYDLRPQFSARTGGATSIQQLDNIRVLLGADVLAYGGDFRGGEAAFTVVGNGKFRTDTGGGVYQQWLNLTDNGASKWGSGWLTARQPVQAGFTCDFQWRISHFAGVGADGLCFVIQDKDLSQNPGETGVADHALNFCFDTYQNAGELSDTVFSVREGTTIRTAVNLLPAGLSFNYNPVGLPYNGRYDVHIDYQPGDLDVFVNDALVVDSLGVDLQNLAGGAAVDRNGYAWLGFSARTGGATENHDVLNWHFATLPPVERPGTLLLVR